MSQHDIRGARIAVSGGCGFIGSHLVRRLAERGAGSIVVLDKMKHGACSRLPGEARVVRFELGSDDTAGLMPHLDGIEYVFHMAAEKHSQQRPDAEQILSSNVLGTQALWAAAARGGARKVIFASSVYAYGRTHAPAMLESERPEPRTVYGISKLAGEHLTAAAASDSGFEWMSLRYFFVYGPGQHQGTGYRSVITKNAARLLGGQPPIVHGDGEQALDYVYVDDVIDATLLALESPCSGETLNVASGRPTTVNRLLGTLANVAGTSSEAIAMPPDWTAGTWRVGSIERAEKLLGWRPKIDLEEGLARTCAWMRSERAL